jgi:hypothetical protein
MTAGGNIMAKKKLVIGDFYDGSSVTLKKYIDLDSEIDKSKNVVNLKLANKPWGRIAFITKGKKPGVYAYVLKDGKEKELARRFFSADDPLGLEDDFDEAQMDIGEIIVHLYTRGRLEAYKLIHYCIGADAREFGVVRWATGSGGTISSPPFLDDKRYQLILGRRGVPDYSFGFDTLDELKAFVFDCPDHLAYGYVTIYKVVDGVADMLCKPSAKKHGQGDDFTLLAEYTKFVRMVSDGTRIELPRY